MIRSLAGLLALCLFVWTGEAAARQTVPTAAAVSPPPAQVTGARSGELRKARIDPATCKLPQYPPHAGRWGEAGTVILNLLVSAQGEVTSTRLLKSSGFDTLDSAAMVSISACRFKPAMSDGKAVEAWTEVTYVWKMDQRLP